MSQEEKSAAGEGGDALPQLALLERENRKLRREITHLQNAIHQEKLASTTLLNQQKASTFLQRERERSLALLLANSPSVILFLSPEGRVEFCTEYFVAKAGYENATQVQGQLLSVVVSRFLDPEGQARLLAESHKAIESGLPVELDVTFHFVQSGAAEEFAGMLVPMKDGEQQGNGLMLMFHNITDLKRSREAALEASKAKSAFLSNMSHEIRTPMNAIIGMTSIGRQEKDLERKDYAFDKIQSASTHLLGVINDILDISKIESGRMELSNVDFGFHEMLDRVMSVISLKMQEKRQHFSIEVDPNIPQKLHGDDQRIAQVITNILANAMKFTPEGGSILFRADLRTRLDKSCMIEMSVTDSGIGMSENEKAKLFNIFQQAEAGTARKYGGSGLGLALSKRILEMMGGEIWAESEPGKGSRFTFTADFSIPDSVESTADAAPDQPDEDEQDDDFSGRVLLLVDDIDINLEICAALLEPTNITIVTAKDGQEAFDAFAKDPARYDIILMDVQMPVVDGLQSTEMIRALGTPKATTIPIIAMTANVFKEDIDKCIAVGMDDHLGKPIVIADVLRMLRGRLKQQGL